MLALFKRSKLFKKKKKECPVFLPHLFCACSHVFDLCPWIFMPSWVAQAWITAGRCLSVVTNMPKPTLCVPFIVLGNTTFCKMYTPSHRWWLACAHCRILLWVKLQKHYQRILWLIPMCCTNVCLYVLMCVWSENKACCLLLQTVLLVYVKCLYRTLTRVLSLGIRLI